MKIDLSSENSQWSFFWRKFLRDKTIRLPNASHCANQRCNQFHAINLFSAFISFQHLTHITTHPNKRIPSRRLEPPNHVFARTTWKSIFGGKATLQNRRRALANELSHAPHFLPVERRGRWCITEQVNWHQTKWFQLNEFTQIDFSSKNLQWSLL